MLRLPQIQDSAHEHSIAGDRVKNAERCLGYYKATDAFAHINWACFGEYAQDAERSVYLKINLFASPCIDAKQVALGTL